MIIEAPTISVGMLKGSKAAGGPPQTPNEPRQIRKHSDALTCEWHLPFLQAGITKLARRHSGWMMF